MVRACRPTSWSTSSPSSCPCKSAGRPTPNLLLLAFLVGYGNAKSLAVGSAVPNEWWVGLPFGLGLCAGALAWAFIPPRLSAAEIGLAGRGGWRSAAVGSALALGVGLVALLVLRFPPLIDAPIRYAPIADAAPSALLLRALVLMPLDTAIPEELAFRGVLLGRLLRTGGPPRAVFVSAAAFMLWHTVIVIPTLGQTNLGEELAPLAVSSALAAVFAGGVLFAILRLRTAHLAAPIAAHTTFNAVLLVGLSLGG